MNNGNDDMIDTIALQLKYLNNKFEIYKHISSNKEINDIYETYSNSNNIE